MRNGKKEPMDANPSAFLFGSDLGHVAIQKTCPQITQIFTDYELAGKVPTLEIGIDVRSVVVCESMKCPLRAFH